MLEKSVQDVGKMSSIELLRPMVYAIMEFYREPQTQTPLMACLRKWLYPQISYWRSLLESLKIFNKEAKRRWNKTKLVSNLTNS